MSNPSPDTPQDIRIIGLTGPMCAGKNRVGELLAIRGYIVLDTDPVAHQALHAVKDAVLLAFTSEAVKQGLCLTNNDGSINRRALGTLLFSDPQLLSRHEGIIYPKIDELINEFIREQATKDSCPGIVINAPLLHKSAVLSRCQLVIFVHANLFLRIFRSRRRDKLPFIQIFRRFYAQRNLFSQYFSKGVDILKVNNHGSIRALQKKLDRLLSQRGY